MVTKMPLIIKSWLAYEKKSLLFTDNSLKIIDDRRWLAFTNNPGIISRMIKFQDKIEVSHCVCPINSQVNDNIRMEVKETF